MSKIQLYTDSSKSANDRKVGIAFVVVKDNKPLFRYARQIDGITNNRGEVFAIKYALSYAFLYATTYPTNRIQVFSDSNYAVKTINKVYRRKHHQDLFDEIDELIEKIKKLKTNVSINWIKAHNGNRWNEEADYLANQVRLR